MIVAVDGPAGAGKSTVAKLLAKKIKFTYIDTGAMYRALTLKAIEEEIDINDQACLIQIAKTAKIELSFGADGALKVFLDGKDVSTDIRHPRITKLVSDLAKIKEVRQIMLRFQRDMCHKQDSVLDGRDIGTVVFPDAERKFYIDADPEERARRRYKELALAGQQVSFSDIQIDVNNRDSIDSGRKFAPLKKAPDAIYIDTTNMTIEQVVNKMLSHIHG